MPPKSPASSDLIHRFVELVHRIAQAHGAVVRADDSLQNASNALISAYSQPGRHYHSSVHLQRCLDHLDEYRDKYRDEYRDGYQLSQNVTSLDANALDIIEYALFFHDAIYDPESHANEANSAKWAAKVLVEQLGEIAPLVDCVHRLIMATQFHDIAPDAQTALLLDIDLSILSASAGEFDAYDHAIRLEYAFVPDADYQRGRAQVLQRFLDAEVLYQSAFFSGKTAAAKANLRRALARLA